MSHFVEILTFFKDYVIHDISIIRSLNNQHCFILNYASHFVEILTFFKD